MSKKEIKEQIEKKDPDNIINTDLKEKLEKEIVHYEFGDLVVTCSVCGHSSVLHTNVEGGIVLPNPLIATNSRAHFGLGCSNCKASLIMNFREAANPPSEEEIAKMREEREQAKNLLEEQNNNLKTEESDCEEQVDLPEPLNEEEIKETE